MSIKECIPFVFGQSDDQVKEKMINQLHKVCASKGLGFLHGNIHAAFVLLAQVLRPFMLRRLKVRVFLASSGGSLMPRCPPCRWTLPKEFLRRSRRISTWACRKCRCDGRLSGHPNPCETSATQLLTVAARNVQVNFTARVRNDLGEVGWLV